MIVSWSWSLASAECHSLNLLQMLHFPPFFSLTSFFLRLYSWETFTWSFTGISKAGVS